MGDATRKRLRWDALSLAVILAASELHAEGKVRAVTVIGPVHPRVAALSNAAGITIDIMPTAQVELGQRLAFKVSAKRPGYLILVDVDATGKVTQIYPNLHSMRIPQGASETSNLLEPGKPVSIPDARNPFAHFEFVAEPPSGRGMIIALLSAKPVHVVDLPDVPPDQLEGEAAAGFLQQAAQNLKIAPQEARAPLADPQWSFAAAAYTIGR
jgi:hypothetical protein